jgi:hypothetical protein
MAEAENNAYDEIAPGTQQEETEKAEEEPVESETLIYVNVDRDSEYREYDIGNGIGCSISSAKISSNEIFFTRCRVRCSVAFVELKTERVLQSRCSLNKNKRCIFVNTSFWCSVIGPLYHSLYRMLNLK